VDAYLKSHPLAAAKIIVHSVPLAGKRKQLVAAIPKARGSIIALADDDVFWPTTAFLPSLLAPFDDKMVGATGGKQSVRILHGGDLTVWEAAATRRLYVRNVYVAAQNAIDGGFVCLEGRTALFRAEIISDKEFLDGFVNEKWVGKLQDSGDDTFTTRWCLARNWKMVFQHSEKAELLTIAEDNPKFMKQLVRWGDSTVKSYSRIVSGIPQIWSHPWTAAQMVTLLARPLLTVMNIYAWWYLFNVNPNRA
jgi:hypothetical protein